MTAQITEVTRGELESRRAAILERLGVSYEEFGRRASTYMLTAEEWVAWDELSAVEFLLDES